MRVVIVDDEPLARRGVRAHLVHHPDVEIVAECATGKAAVRALNETAADLVFLDIRMPDLSGFEVLRELGADKLPLVVFLTAYDQYAIQAFQVHAFDYLLKPIEEMRLSAVLAQARRRMTTLAFPALGDRLTQLLDHIEKHQENARYAARFTVPGRQRILIVPVDEIDWISAAGDYVTLHVGDKHHLLRSSMNGVEAQLDPARFIRIHRSAIVQGSRLRELVTLDNHEYLVRLSDGTELKVSRSYSDRLERWL